MYLNFLYLLLIFILIVGLLGFVVYFLRSVYLKEKDFEKKRDEVYGNYEVILKDAHTKAETVLARAAADATSLSQETRQFDEKVSQTMAVTVDQMMKQNLQLLDSNFREFFTEYTTALKTMRDRYQQDIDAILQDVHTSTVRDFTTLKDTMHKDILEEQASIKAELEGAHEQAKIDISEYRKHKMAQIDESINHVLLKVIQQVMGRTIPINDQQQLVIDALEKAKKEDVFTL